MAAATQRIIIHADDKTGAAIASAVRNTKKLDTQMKRTGDNFRNTTRQSRAHLGQLGHQVQDVAVQLQMGMNPLMVFGQQGSQVASIFGAKGALVGGLIAVAAVLAQQLIPNLFEASRAAGEFHDDIIKAAGGVDKLTEAQRRLATLDLQLRIGEQQKAVDDARAALERYNQNIADSIALHQQNPFGFIEDVASEDADAINLLEQALQLAIARLEATKERMEALTGKTREQEAAVKALSLAQKKADREALERMKAIFAAEDLRAKKFKRDALERMELLMDSMSAEQKFVMESQRLQKILSGPDGIMNPTETEAYRVAIEKLTQSLFKTGDAIETIEDSNKKMLISLQDVKRDGIMSLEESLIGLIDGTKSVKDAFKDMARSIINDLIQMQIRNAITVPLANSMNIPLSGKRASGGPVSANKPYLVGEKGPEIMIPQGAGRVMSNKDSMGPSQAPSVVVNVSTGVSQTVRAEITNLLPQITNAAKSAVADARQRGGGFSKALVGV